jgi:hypothetical protein
MAKFNIKQSLCSVDSLYSNERQPNCEIINSNQTGAAYVEQ